MCLIGQVGLEPPVTPPAAAPGTRDSRRVREANTQHALTKLVKDAKTERGFAP